MFLVHVMRRSSGNKQWIYYTWHRVENLGIQCMGWERIERKLRCNAQKNRRVTFRIMTIFQWVHKKICSFCTSSHSLHFYLLSHTHGITTFSRECVNLRVHGLVEGTDIRFNWLCSVTTLPFPFGTRLHVEPFRHKIRTSPHPKMHCAETANTHWSDAHDHNNTNKNQSLLLF